MTAPPVAVTLPSWEAYVSSTVAPPLNREPTLSFLLGMTEPIRRWRADIASMVLGFDPDSAVGIHLDHAGGRVFEPRGGMGDDEYRRIVVGKMMATAAEGQMPFVWATWLALSGVPASRAYINRWPSSTSVRPCVHLKAQVPFSPSPEFRSRAASVLRTAVALHFDITAVMYGGDSLVGHGPLSWRESRWPWGII